MSDFTSGFWSNYIIIATVLALLFCVFLITIVSGKIEKNAKNEPTHVWDGNLSEYNNPLPGWWRWLFIAFLVFSAGYLLYYPGLGSFAGVGQWTQEEQFNREMQALNDKVQPIYDGFLASSAEDLAKDAQAMAMGERLFLNNCALCHGSDAQGSIGFPNLKSGAWNWGGSPEQIKESITEGRYATMPGGLVNETELPAVIAYLRTFSGGAQSAEAMAGKPLYDERCGSCHGEDGKGNLTGLPDLTDQVWVYGSSDNAIANVINKGINGDNSMPAHKDLLSPGKIHLLTAYVRHLNSQ
ncbi:MAG: cytochrome-c oxidase, cbb3-type subunit III [Burkholderiales bacterium]|jgi:cytochrome c oxidase cbb3-type subunit 3|nr:cytochrome-c oxidase, cbb3-type subunit III [Burkholderiales bacterium]